MPGLAEDTLTNRRPVLPAIGISYYSLPTGLGLHFIMMQMSGLSLAVATEISLSFSTLTDTGTILMAVGGASASGSQQVRFHSVCCLFSDYGAL